MNYESDGDGGQVSLQRILNGRCSVRSLSRLEKSWTPQGYAATHQGAIVQRGRRLKFWFWIICTNFVCLCLCVIMFVFVCLSMRELVIIRRRLSHWAGKKEYNLTAECLKFQALASEWNLPLPLKFVKPTLRPLFTNKSVLEQSSVCEALGIESAVPTIMWTEFV